MCNCNNKIHCLETVTVTDTNVVLTVTNSTNISSLECFHFNSHSFPQPCLVLWFLVASLSGTFTADSLA